LLYKVVCIILCITCSKYSLNFLCEQFTIPGDKILWTDLPPHFCGFPKACNRTKENWGHRENKRELRKQREQKRTEGTERTRDNWKTTHWPLVMGRSKNTGKALISTELAHNSTFIHYVQLSHVCMCACAARCRLIALSVCPSVCLSVCQSVSGHKNDHFEWIRNACSFFLQHMATNEKKNLHTLHKQESHNELYKKRGFCSLSKLLNKTTLRFQYFLLLVMVAHLFQIKHSLHWAFLHTAQHTG